QRDEAVASEKRAREAEQRATTYLELVEFYRTVQTDPGTLTRYRGKAGQSYHFEVTGIKDGLIYGTNEYTDESPLATAAAHAGILRDGQKGIVRVTILPGRDNYPGSSSKGVTSSAWIDPWPSGYRVEPVNRFTNFIRAGLLPNTAALIP